jgi:glyoxylase-like metal-dependent hydrolase (beta-lactamase superfamily II)
MRRIVLGTLVAIGTVSVAAAGLLQAPQPEVPRVIEAQKIAANLYMLTGPGGASKDVRDPSGGNVGVFVTGNGVVVVDAKNPGWGRPILDRIRMLTDKPVVMVIDTHTHGDHVSGQVEFPANIEVVAHEQSNINMRKTAMPRDERVKIFEGQNAKFLPTKTFKDKMSIGTGQDRIDLYYFGRGHTNGDAWVVFPALRAMHAGDMFAGKTVPNIDQNNDGSAIEFSNTLTKAIAGIPNVDTIITGHSVVMAWNDLKEYAQYTKDLLATTQAAFTAGTSLDEAAKAYTFPDKYKDYNFRYPVRQYMDSVYNDMKKK